MKISPDNASIDKNSLSNDENNEKSANSNDINKFEMLRKSNVNNPIIAYYNINSLRNKIHDLRCIISKALPDILVLAEMKIDQSFPTSQFLINEYNEPTRCDRTNFRGGIVEYSRKGIIHQRLKPLELSF